MVRPLNSGPGLYATFEKPRRAGIEETPTLSPNSRPKTPEQANEKKPVAPLGIQVTVYTLAEGTAVFAKLSGSAVFMPLSRKAASVTGV